MKASSPSTRSNSAPKCKSPGVPQKSRRNSHSAPLSGTKTPIYVHDNSDFIYTHIKSNNSDSFRQAKVTEDNSIKRHVNSDTTNGRNEKNDSRKKTKAVRIANIRKDDDASEGSVRKKIWPVHKPDDTTKIRFARREAHEEKRKCCCRQVTYEHFEEIKRRNVPVVPDPHTYGSATKNALEGHSLPKDPLGRKKGLSPRRPEDRFSVFRVKKPVKRPFERKVDDIGTYRPLMDGRDKQLRRLEYERHFNLRIRGASVLNGLSFDPGMIYNLGEHGSGLRSRGKVQDFYELRDECLDNGTLFDDPDFPPDNSSLYYSQRPDRLYEWKRPHEICSNPQLFVEGYSRFDVQQGELGDCWLLAAVANLTLYRRLFFQVVPEDQSFEDKYAGIFHFRFWQYGRWIDVVIDDKLPTYRGQLVFLHSTEENEFWSALLEKAYAKLHGSYEALKGGSTCEAMEDFTGGVTEMYEMNATPPNLFKIVLKAYERSSLMGCSLEPDPNVLEAETPDGLIRGHAYSITRVKYVDISTPNTTGKIPLLRLRNPWGNECEWNGPWSDKSPEWRFIPEHEKEELGLTFDDDGEFWMSFNDFKSHFDRMEICNLNPDSLTEEELQEGNKKRWEVSFYEGEWVRGVTAGGCRNYLETFWNNPQYRITLTEVDEGDDDGKCTLIVALMQKNRRSQRNMGIDILTIGFAIYHLPYPDSVPKPLDLNFFKYNASVARSPSFINLREVSCRFKLPPGVYCIVPSTFEKNEEGEFLLRVFSEHKNNMEENDEDVHFGDIDARALQKLSSKKPKTNADCKSDFKVCKGDLKVKDVEPTPEDRKQTDRIYELFMKLAGDDGEVDWKELKDILDYAMRLEMPMYKTDTKGVEAGPPSQTEGSDCTQLLLTALPAVCCLLCLTLCQKSDGANQGNNTNALAPIVTSCFSNMCSQNASNAQSNNRTSNNHNYSNVDNEIVSTQPAPSSNETRNKGFSKDVCRSMVAMLDADHSGKLGYQEFKTLWSDIKNWKMIFRLYDKDNSATLNGFELRQALNSAGYHINNRILNVLVHRYANSNGTLEFDEFLMCAVKLQTMIEKTGGIDEETLIRELQEERDNIDNARYFQEERSDEY